MVTFPRRYDAADRRTSVTCPNGILANCTYDAANHLAGISHLLGATTPGELTYAYGAAGIGRKSTACGRANLPPALASLVYYEPYGQATASGASTGNAVTFTGREIPILGMIVLVLIPGCHYRWSR